MDASRRAEEILLTELSYRPEGMSTLAIIDLLAQRGTPAALALETVWRLRDARRVEMRGGRVVAADPLHATPPSARHDS